MDLVPLYPPVSRDNGFGPTLSTDNLIGNSPAEERDDGWLLGFVDVLMLLLTLFVLLLAFTQLPRHADAHASASAASHHKAPAHHRGTPSSQPAAAVPAAQTPPATPVVALPEAIRDQVQVTTSASDVNLVIKDDVLFDAGSDDLKSAGQDVLAGIARLLKQNDHTVSVEGHTDNTPIHTARFPSNWELSAARATNVTRRLIQLGVGADRLRAIGFADTKPLDSNATARGRARNRRVSLVIHLNEPAAEAQSREIGQPTTHVTGSGSQGAGR